MDRRCHLGGHPARPALPDTVPPQMQGICSSGSTGTPKVILTLQPGTDDDRLSTVLASSWIRVPRPQVVLVLAPMYHATTTGGESS